MKKTNRKYQKGSIILLFCLLFTICFSGCGSKELTNTDGVQNSTTQEVEYAQNSEISKETSLDSNTEANVEDNTNTEETDTLKEETTEEKENSKSEDVSEDSDLLKDTSKSSAKKQQNKNAANKTKSNKNTLKANKTKSVSEKSISKNSNKTSSTTQNSSNSTTQSSNDVGEKYVSVSDGSNTTEDQYQTDPVPEGQQNPVEPEDTTVDTTKKGTCSLLVECSTILDNMDDLTKGKEDLVPKDGILYKKTTVTFYEGESVADVLKREMKNNSIHLEYSSTPIYNSDYIEGIGNLYEFDCGNLSGWTYCVNSWFPNYGCSRYVVTQGDVIEWHYTCDLGADVGMNMSEW